MAKKEFRVYIVNPSNRFSDKFQEFIPHNSNFNEENFIKAAEIDGTVYSLNGFQNAFNEADISDEQYILIKEVETHE